MASITTADINKRYAVSGNLINAHLAVERLNLVSDAGQGALTDAAIAKALDSLAGFTAAGTSTVVKTGVKVTAPITGSGTSGVTFTIANGVVTGIVLS